MTAFVSSYKPTIEFEYLPAGLEYRFWRNVQSAAADQCWIWEGALSKGYGQFSVRGTPRKAHRIAWVLLRGDIPQGLTIEHECRTEACVNPYHFDLWPQKKNRAGAVNQYRDITHCSRGHKFTEGSFTLRGKSRHCKRCAVIRVDEMRARKRRTLA